MEDNLSKKIDIEILHMLEDMRKMNAQTHKIMKESFYYPFVIGASLIVAGATLSQLFLK